MTDITKAVKLDTSAINVDQAIEEVAKEEAGIPTEPTMKEEVKNWINAPVVAAIAAVTTGAVTMIGKDNVSIGGVIGCAAGAGAAYLGTKWISETFGIQDSGIGKALGLFVGIDLGYALTNVGTQMQSDRSVAQEANVANYL